MNTNKTAINVIAAMMVVAVLAIAVSAICTPLVCEKNCSTKVEQCDVETVMQLTPITQLAPDVRVVKVVSDNAVYIDMDGTDNLIGEGDIRLTDTCCGVPNTKVGHEGDIGKVISSVPPADIFTYMDSNANGNLDTKDAIYLDLNNDSLVSTNDIRLTDSPPYDISTGMLKADYGEAWSRVEHDDDDRGKPLYDIGRDVAGNPVDTRASFAPGTIGQLAGIIDGDCSGTWTCPDKIYLNQPTNLTQFDNFTTIGDLRLYMPNASDVMPPEMGECMPDCGTKVEQCSKDAVYALRIVVNETPTVGWGYVEETTDGIFKPGAHGEAAYIDMDGDGNVTIGDVRLTYAASMTYPPNSKVAECDIDLDGLTLLRTPGLPGPIVFNPGTEQMVFKYIDVDGIGGYSLADPVYMDTDNSSDASRYDVRITQSPICNISDDFGNVIVTAGAWGAKWSIVAETDYDAIHDKPLIILPNRAGNPANVSDLLGYIDSDCSLDWTCVDKLYLQQLVGPDNYDLFVTIGDVRLYIPPDAVGTGDVHPCWEPCGTKVWQCDVDLVYAVENVTTYAPNAEVRYVDTFTGGGFSFVDAIEGDGLYFDMDASATVTEGDIRLSDICTTYDPNTKVGGDKANNSDLGDFFAGSTNDMVLYADIDSIPGFSLGDPLYLNVDIVQFFLTGIEPGMIRLTQCPVYDSTYYGDAGSVGGAWTRVLPNDDDDGWGFPGSGVNTVVAVPGQVAGPEDITRIFDSDCSQTWTCPDKLYLQQLNNGLGNNSADFVGDFVTIGDERLYIPAGGEEPAEPAEPADWCEYYDMIANGGNNNGITEITEAWNAIQDYVAGTLDITYAWEVIQCYLADR
jgi:hypothetical protein